MKLKSFRIKNYRSIVDTHWTKLAPDNITTLIGQNESGKTSVLEGLNSFYNGQINEDILRSDLSLPLISCCFEVSDQELDKILDWQDISEDIASQVRNSNNIILHREWITKNESRFFYGDDEILGAIKASKEESKRLETELVGKAERISVE